MEGLFRERLGVGRRLKGVFWVQFVSETAQVELKSGRV